MEFENLSRPLYWWGVFWEGRCLLLLFTSCSNFLLVVSILLAFFPEQEVQTDLGQCVVADCCCQSNILEDRRYCNGFIVQLSLGHSCRPVLSASLLLSPEKKVQTDLGQGVLVDCYCQMDFLENLKHFKFLVVQLSFGCHCRLVVSASFLPSSLCNFPPFLVQLPSFL
jgi:hypothetical protein